MSIERGTAPSRAYSRAQDYILEWRRAASGPEALFVSRLDGLPDFWDPCLAADEQGTRIAGVLQRQREFVQALGFLSAPVTIQLRICALPDSSRRVEIHFIVGVEFLEDAEGVWRLFHASFPGDLDLRLKMLPSREVSRLLDLPVAGTDLFLYDWQPERTLANIPGDDPVLLAPPLDYRADSKVQVLRVLAQQEQPLMLIYTLRPVGLENDALRRTIERWQERLGTLDAAITLGTGSGGLEELEGRYAAPGDALVQTEIVAGIQQRGLEDYVVAGESRRRQSNLYVGQRQRLLQAREIGQRFVQSSTYYFWRVSAVAGMDVPAELQSAVAVDLAQGSTIPSASRFRCRRVEQGGEAHPDLNSLYAQVRLSQPNSTEAGLYHANADVVDVQGAVALLSVPILPRGGIPGVAGYPANPFASWQLQEPALEETRQPRQSLSFGDYVDSRMTLLSRSGQMAEIELDDLTRHALITGSTGAGKSTTCKRMLLQLHRAGVPFMVIEPVKDEYPDLAFSPEFLAADPRRYPLVYQLGNARNMLWFNPFYIRPGSSVAEHIGYLQSCFFAAFPMPGIFAIVFTRVLERAYEEKAEEVKKSKNLSARPYDGTRIVQQDWPDDHFPTLAETEQVAQGVLKKLGYTGEFAHNLDAAIHLRLQHLQSGVIGSLLQGKGHSENRCQPVSFERGLPKLLQEPLILQMASIGDKSEKALLIAFMLTALYEYYALQPAVEGLQHVTLVEEAHVLLENVPRQQSEDSANTQGKAIELFADMLAEIRSRGEGMIIAEQLPSKLILEAIKNTNLKIMHRLTARDDREVLGAAMNLNEQQSRFATTLRRGQAIVFREGLSEPALVQVRPIVIDARQRCRIDRILARQRWILECGEWRMELPPTIMVAFDRCAKARRDFDSLRQLLESISSFLHQAGLPDASLCAQLWTLQRLVESDPDRHRLFGSVARQALLAGAQV